jgi:hypothetical protein
LLLKIFLICFKYIVCFQKIVDKNIFMKKSKYIFVPYEGRFDANIFLKGIFAANIFYA